MASSSTVSLVFSKASLLSGGLHDCYDVHDVNCEGGIALVDAYLRQYSDGVDEASLVVNELDSQSVFVQMHPLDWNVNRLVLHDYFGYNNYYAKPSLLEQHRVDSQVSNRDLSGLQTHRIKTLMKADIAPSVINSWSQYTRNIILDEKSGLAVMVADGSGVSSVKILLSYLSHENAARGCSLESANSYNSQLIQLNRTQSIRNGASAEKCLIPILIKTGEGPLHTFLDAVLDNEHHPSLIIDVEGEEVSSYGMPQRIRTESNSNADSWILSYDDDVDVLRQIRISPLNGRASISKVEVLEHSMENFDNVQKDEKLAHDIAFLRELADEALQNDPIKGLSMAMPIMRTNRFRACFGGECPIGNLVTDALRWYTNVDFAFIESSGLQGLGWPEGAVKVREKRSCWLLRISRHVALIPDVCSSAHRFQISGHHCHVRVLNALGS